MGQFVCAGAMLQCTFGMAPGSFMVIDPLRPKVQNKPIANIMDNKPMVNIMPFGMCQSMANPTVASATAAALGVLTPMPCIPVVMAPWAPPGQVKISNLPALINNAKCMCNWGGQISVTMPGNICPAQGK
ncbi:MAG: DUF4280 domain-containing protein [Paludibacteraceae bacterium]|nr:DUF4280 domain-containing protein [Paludibacteraceae bacterium]